MSEIQECLLDPNMQQVIREKAYYKWEAAGSPAGDGVDFWFAAEKEIQMAMKVADRWIKNPEILDELKDRLESEDIVDWDENKS